MAVIVGGESSEATLVDLEILRMEAASGRDKILPGL